MYHSATTKASGLRKPVNQFVHSAPATARKHADLQPRFRVLAVKLSIEILQRELNVRGEDAPQNELF
jgi:hypothetical protein